MNQIDDELRARFAELRERDEAGAPGFDPMWQRADRFAPRRRVRFVWAAAAAGVIVAAGLLLGRHRPQPTDPTAGSIVTWTSPTASLLQMSNVVAVFTPPSLLSSALDGVTSPAAGR
jgi:hypothetical protein